MEPDNRGKISFTHIITWALLRALRDFPALNSSYQVDRRRTSAPHQRAINVGIAVDVERKEGSRTLLVPNIKNAGNMSFHEFVRAYDDTIARDAEGNDRSFRFSGHDDHADQSRDRRDRSRRFPG